MTDLDLLRDIAPHPGLDGIEQRVLARVAARQREAAGSRTTLGLAAVAMLMGVAGSWFPAAPAQAAATFGTPGALAPSTLLLGDGQ